LCRTLDVDVEYQVAARLARLVDLGPVGSIVIAEDVGVFQELAAEETLLELPPGDELVVLAVALGAPPLPGGVGHGKAQAGHPGHKSFD